MKGLLCRAFGHHWHYGWQGNGNVNRRECARCWAVQRRQADDPRHNPWTR